MRFRSGGEFEKAVLDSRSSDDLVQRHWSQVDFSEDIIELLNSPGPECPEIGIGRSLFYLIKGELELRAINTDGLVFRSGINTKVDARHWSDAVGRIPSIPNIPFTIDLFNITPSDMLALESVWISMSKKSGYSNYDFQSDLFRYKKGLVAWKKKNGIPRDVVVCLSLGKYRGEILELPKRGVLLPFVDFRKYSDRRRPENHFILTPYDIETPQRRKVFAQMIAGYFAAVAKGNDRQNLAQQSP